ncbi:MULTISPECIES: hypothetical protein [Vagococcus]|uniref:LURP-one-related/scramblase family protein n=1 Tax=Vagococcus TaxID=2737 RepID=UPI002FCB472B
MATYYIEEHLLSAKVRVFIKNESDEPVFLLLGNWGVKGDSVSIYDLDGQRLAKATQKSDGFRAKFDLYDSTSQIGTMKQLFALKRDYYVIKKVNWLVIGHIPKKRYQIISFKKRILEAGVISKEGKRFFKIMIPNKEQAPVLICAMAVLDYWARNAKKLEELSKLKEFHLEVGQKSYCSKKD